MAETFTLTTPITPATRVSYRHRMTVLNWEAGVFQGYIVGSDGAEILVEYTGAQANALLSFINGMTTPSVQKKLFQKFVNDGKLTAGTVSGTPT